MTHEIYLTHTPMRIHPPVKNSCLSVWLFVQYIWLATLFWNPSI